MRTEPHLLEHSPSVGGGGSTPSSHSLHQRGHHFTARSWWSLGPAEDVRQGLEGITLTKTFFGQFQSHLVFLFTFLCGLLHRIVNTLKNRAKLKATRRIIGWKHSTRRVGPLSPLQHIEQSSSWPRPPYCALFAWFRSSGAYR